MALQTTLVKVKEAFLDLLFPPRCIGCGMEGDFLCGSCRDLFPALEPPLCELCGVPLASGGFCQNCIDSNLDVDGIRSPFVHQGLVREAVHYLKYQNMKVLARPMAGLMAEYLKSNSLPADIITAVPIHSRRMHQRGYNQSDLLAEELSRSIELPTSRGTLTRLRNTPSQVSLGASERRSNVEGAFQCKYQVFQNRRVLLIDDVCTTGATLNACAVALKEAGALSVWGLTLSREC